jgi:hypothetical protein
VHPPPSSLDVTGGGDLVHGDDHFLVAFGGAPRVEGEDVDAGVGEAAGVAAEFPGLVECSGCCIGTPPLRLLRRSKAQTNSFEVGSIETQGYQTGASVG